MKPLQIWAHIVTIALLLGLVGLSVVQLNMTLAMQKTVEQVESDIRDIKRDVKCLINEDCNDLNWGSDDFQRTNQTYVIGGV